MRKNSCLKVIAQRDGRIVVKLLDGRIVELFNCRTVEWYNRLFV